jgi:hypothetical protein
MADFGSPEEEAAHYKTELKEKQEELDTLQVTPMPLDPFDHRRLLAVR